MQRSLSQRLKEPNYDTQKNVIYWSCRCLCWNKLQNSEFVSFPRIHERTIWNQNAFLVSSDLCTNGVSPPGAEARLSSVQLCFPCKIIEHLKLGWVMWEQIGEFGSKMCKFMPSGCKKGKCNKSVHSTWVGKATTAGIKSAAFSCQTWPLDALISWCRAASQKNCPHIRRPWGSHIWLGFYANDSQAPFAETTLVSWLISGLHTLA